MPEEHVGANPIPQPVVDRPDMQIDRLEAAKGAFHHGQGFVRLDRGVVGKGVLGQAGAHGVEAVESGFGCNALFMDSHVTWIRNDIDPIALRRLLTAREGLPPLSGDY